MSLSEATRLLALWRAKLHWGWRNSRQYWFAETAHECIWVDHETYCRVVKEELKKRGIEQKTRSEYLKPGEEAWNRQWAIEDEIRSNIDLWKQVSGVEIYVIDHNKQNS
jgi:hypothetical protein